MERAENTVLTSDGDVVAEGDSIVCVYNTSVEKELTLESKYKVLSASSANDLVFVVSDLGVRESYFIERFKKAAN
jgi:hypothetical protein